MTETTCTRVRAEATLAENPPSAATRQHLASCRACREELVRLERVLAALARDAEVHPSPEHDRRMRRLLRGARTARSLMRPGLAAGLGLASFVALVGGLAAEVAGKGAGDSALPVALLAVSIYLAMGGTATLPLLLRLRRPLRAEVKS